MHDWCVCLNARMPFVRYGIGEMQALDIRQRI